MGRRLTVSLGIATLFIVAMASVAPLWAIGETLFPEEPRWAYLYPAAGIPKIVCYRVGENEYVGCIPVAVINNFPHLWVKAKAMPYLPLEHRYVSIVEGTAHGGSAPPAGSFPGPSYNENQTGCLIVAPNLTGSHGWLNMCVKVTGPGLAAAADAAGGEVPVGVLFTVMFPTDEPTDYDLDTQAWPCTKWEQNGEIVWEWEQRVGVILDISVSNESINEKPVADAGENQNVAVGDTVSLDGSGSSDPDGDALTYEWSFSSMPVGSFTEIDGPTGVTASFVPDVPGEYIVRLAVNDGIEDSVPDEVVVTATSPEVASEETLIETVEVIIELPVESLQNQNSSNALSNKIDAALAMIDEGRYEEALGKLRNDILQKTDGCANGGEPDNNDWITTCESQAEVYPLVLRTIELLQRLLLLP